MLQEFIDLWLFSFLLIFTRVGTALMLMPGIGDSFTPTNVRLLFALGLSLVMTPVLVNFLPGTPSTPAAMFFLIASEVIVGFFIGTIMRVLMSAIDTMGMIVSLNTGFANAQVFNPGLGSQGSIIGALMTIFGTTMILTSNMHHFLLLSIFESYQLFDPNILFQYTGQMADIIAQVVNASFNTGVKLAMPFIIVSLIIYLGFGLLGRLMPQIQVFFLALPVQIIVATLTLFFVFSSVILFFLSYYEEAVTRFLAL